MTPSPLVCALLVLAVYRLWRMIGLDEILDPVRERLLGASYEPEGWTFRREKLAQFIECPYCLGFWLAVAAYAAWASAPTPTLYVVTPLAISGAVGLVGSRLDPS